MDKVEGCWVVDCGEDVGALPDEVSAGSISLASAGVTLLSIDPSAGLYPGGSVAGVLPGGYSVHLHWPRAQEYSR